MSASGGEKIEASQGGMFPNLVKHLVNQFRRGSDHGLLLAPYLPGAELRKLMYAGGMAQYVFFLQVLLQRRDDQSSYLPQAKLLQFWLRNPAWFEIIKQNFSHGYVIAQIRELLNSSSNHVGLKYVALKLTCLRKPFAAAIFQAKEWALLEYLVQGITSANDCDRVSTADPLVAVVKGFSPDDLRGLHMIVTTLLAKGLQDKGGIKKAVITPLIKILRQLPEGQVVIRQQVVNKMLEIIKAAPSEDGCKNAIEVLKGVMSASYLYHSGADLGVDLQAQVVSDFFAILAGARRVSEYSLLQGMVNKLPGHPVWLSGVDVLIKN